MLTLSLGGGARVYTLTYDGSRWQIRLSMWNGVAYEQSAGIHIFAASTESMASNAFHWIGITAPYSPVCEELESNFPVRITRFSSASSGSAESEVPVEEAIVHLRDLAGKGGELQEMASRAAREVSAHTQ